MRTRLLLLIGLAAAATAPLYVSAGGSTALAEFAAVFPDVKSIGIVYSDAGNRAAIKSLEEEAKRAGLKLEAVQVPSVKEFPQALNDLKDKVDTFWVLEDPVYGMAEAWKYFIMFSLRHRLKTSAPTRQMLEQGALFHYTEKGEVLINKRVLGALGLTPGRGSAPIVYFGE